LRIILISRNLFTSLLFVTGLAAPLAGQATDSLSAARRVVAAVALAAKEYRTGVPGQPGRVALPAEVDEARQFIEQARFDVPYLPRLARAATDSALTRLLEMFAHAVAADSVDDVARAAGERIARVAGGAIVPLPARPPSPARGAQVYREQCAACHGDQGRGDGPKAKTVKGPPPADLADPKTMSRLSLVDIYRKVTIGVAGTAMPQFEETLPDSDRWAVAAYTATLQYGGSATAGVFTAVRRQLDSAVALRSERLVFGAYLTFEQVETDLRARNPGLTSRLEAEFGRLKARTAAAADPAELATLHHELLADLERAERIVSDRGSEANLFLQSFMLLLREGFEAILIVGALMTFLGKAGAAERRHEVARGAWLAVAASVVTAAIIELLFHFTPGQREALEGVTMLIAVAVLFYVSYWVLSKIEADRWNAFLKGKMQDALSSGSGLALASVAFLAVYREGFETILFYKALLSAAGTGDVGAVVAGIGVGGAGLLVLYVAISRYGMRLPMKPFFAVTGALLYYMAFVFAGQGIKDLQEAGLVGLTVLDGWPRWPQLGIYPTAQSLALQAVLLVLLVGGLVWTRLRRPQAGS
jgi:high-affinity iron transporter